MPNFGMFPQTFATILGPTTLTTSTTTANFTLPPGQSYRLICQINTVTGTSPTMVMILATSCDSGSTYNEVLSSSTMSTTGLGRQLLIRPYLGIGDAATEQSSSLLGVADIAAAVVNNGPLNPQFLKLKLLLGGTSPSYSSVTVQAIALPQDASE
jgi:hypothetical protein